jgi:hypothetical protein
LGTADQVGSGSNASDFYLGGDWFVLSHHGFGLVSRFIGYSLVVTKNNYNTSKIPVIITNKVFCICFHGINAKKIAHQGTRLMLEVFKEDFEILFTVWSSVTEEGSTKGNFSFTNHADSIEVFLNSKS